MVNLLMSFVLTNLISSNNFMIIFIALVVVFFLLGLILGLTINSVKKSRNLEDKQVPAKDINLEEKKQTDSFEQDSREKIDRQNNSMNQKPTPDKYRNYNNYW